MFTEGIRRLTAATTSRVIYEAAAERSLASRMPPWDVDEGWGVVGGCRILSKKKTSEVQALTRMSFSDTLRSEEDSLILVAGL